MKEVVLLTGAGQIGMAIYDCDLGRSLEPLGETSRTTPICKTKDAVWRPLLAFVIGVEPTACRLGGDRSILLSYTNKTNLIVLFDPFIL